MNKKVAILGIGVIGLLPFWRSGGRKDLNFYEWVWNHTVWGPPIEYVPEEDYEAAFSINRRV